MEGMGSVWGLTGLVGALVLVWGPRWDAGVDGWPRQCEFFKKLKVPELPEGRMKWPPLVSLRDRYRTELAGKALSCNYRGRTSHIHPIGGLPWRVKTVDIKRCWHRWIFTSQVLTWRDEGAVRSHTELRTCWRIQANSSLCRKWGQPGRTT